MSPYPARDAGPIHKVVAEDDGARGKRTRDAGGGEPRRVACRSPSTPAAPEAVKDPSRDNEGDRKNQQAVRREVECASCGLPPRQDETEQAEQTARGEAYEGVSERVRHPEVGDDGAGEKERGRERDTHEVDRREPAARELSRSAHAVSLDEREGHHNDDREYQNRDDDEEGKDWHRRSECGPPPAHVQAVGLV